MRPIRDVTRMVTMPIKAIFVVALCYAINLMTSPQHLWAHWVALGMGIATLVALARGVRTLMVLALAWWVGKRVYERYGPKARAAFDGWMSSKQPAWADVVRAWNDPRTVPGAVVAEADGGPLRH